MQTYPETPGYKERGGTSQLAAMKMKGRDKPLRIKCLHWLSVYPRTGLTADQIATILGVKPGSIRPRMSQLYDLGFAIKSDIEPRKNEDGNPQAVALITLKGYRELLNYMEANTCSM